MFSKKMLRLIVLIVCFGLLSISLSAQAGRGKGRITGTVFDENGKPLPGVEIKIIGLKFSREFATKTDKKGEYAVLGLGTGKWRITTKIKGYLPKYQDKNVSQFTRNKVDFTLQKAPEDTIQDDTLMKDINAAKALFEKKDYKQAAAKFEAILKDNAELHFLKVNVANCYKEMGDTDKAAVLFQDLIKSLKGKTEGYVKDLLTKAYVYLAGYYAGKKDYPKAELYFEKSTELYKKDENLYYNLGELYMNSNKTAKAIEAFKAAVALNAGWETPLAKLGYAYLGAGKMAEAVSVFEKYVTQFPEGKDKRDIAAMLPELKKMVPKK